MIGKIVVGFIIAIIIVTLYYAIKSAYNRKQVPEPQLEVLKGGEE